MIITLESTHKSCTVAREATTDIILKVHDIVT